MGIAATAAHAQQCDPSLVFKKDPVELVRGKEVDGQEAIFADHFRYRYQFASEENKAEFLKNPERYEIQLGGACARMGALSGAGSTGIYAVHEGKIYIFASESCRKTFLARPEKVLETPDAFPSSTEESAKKGRALLEKAVAAMGGAERIDRIRSFRQFREGEDKDGDKTVKTSETITIEFPDRVRRDQQWGEYNYSFMAVGGEGWYQGGKEGFPLHAQQCAALRRQTIGRNLVSILKARNAPGSVVTHEGSGEVDEAGKKVAIEKVTVAFDGATSTLGIEPPTGRIVTLSYRGQDARLYLVPVEQRFSDYGIQGGIKYPMTIAMTYDGKAASGEPASLKSVRIDEEIGAATFQRPSP
jgi:YHS domain-containing protein